MKINLHSPVEEVQIQIIPLIDIIFLYPDVFLLAALQFTQQLLVLICQKLALALRLRCDKC